MDRGQGFGYAADPIEEVLGVRGRRHSLHATHRRLNPAGILSEALLQSHFSVYAGVDSHVQVRGGEPIGKLHQLFAQARPFVFDDQSNEVLAGMARDLCALAGEAGDLLFVAVFEELEILLVEVVLEAALLVDDPGIYKYFLRARAESRLCSAKTSGVCASNIAAAPPNAVAARSREETHARGRGDTISILNLSCGWRGASFGPSVLQPARTPARTACAENSLVVV